MKAAPTDLEPREDIGKRKFLTAKKNALKLAAIPIILSLIGGGQQEQVVYYYVDEYGNPI